MAVAKPLVAAAAALVLASAALAGGPIVRHNATDQAAARAAVLKASDLGTGWRGTVQDVARPTPISCPRSFAPRQDDLVVTGDVSSKFDKTGVAIGTEVTLLQTVQMLRTDWGRSIRPQLGSCLASMVLKDLGSGTKVSSTGKVAFPRIAPAVAAYRVSTVVTRNSQTVRLTVDLVLLSKARAKISITFVYPTAAQPAMVAAEKKIAALVAGRVRG